MTEHPVAARHGENRRNCESSSRLAPLPVDVPDPEPGWATLHPDRALAFLYVSPRAGAVIDELMRL